MPKYSVTVYHTRTIESGVEIEVSAKDEESAEAKINDRIRAALNDGKLDKFDWDESSDDDSFEYEVNEL